jgi:hypothetical protein
MDGIPPRIDRVGRCQRVNQRHPFNSTVAVTRIHGSAPHTNDSRSTAAVKLAGQLAQDSSRDIQVVPGGRFEHSLHSRFDGSWRFAIQSLSLPCQSQEPATPIACVGPSTDPIAMLESLQECCERTGVQMQNVSQLPRVDTRKTADDPNHEALGARDAKRCRHGLGPALKRVVDGPNQTQEVDGVTDRQPGWREREPG